MIVNRDDYTELGVAPEIIYEIACSYERGDNGFTGDTEIAFKLYKFAGELGVKNAKINCADYYFDGRAIGGKNLDLAFMLLDVAIRECDLKNFETFMLMGNILYERLEFKKAVEFLRKIIEDSKISEKNKIQARELEKKCLLKQLEKLYEKVSTNSNASEEKEGKELKEKAEIQFPGWTNLSEEADVFDINNCTELTEKIKLIELVVELQVQASEAALNVARKHVANASEQKLSKEIITALKAKEKEFEKIFQELEAKKEKILKAYQSYIDVTERVIQRQNQVEKHFFNPRRTKKQQTLKLAIELKKRRVSENVLEPLVLDNPPARRTITAERSTMEASIEIFDRASNEYATKTGWSFNVAVQTKKPRLNGGKYTQDYTFTETVQLDNSQVKYKHRTDPHYNHLGDYHMEDVGTYNKIIEVLNKVTVTDSETAQIENEKKIAEVMLKFVHDGMPVTLESLQSINKDLTEDDVHSLNRIFYHCFVKEIARWMLPKEKDHELPLAIAQSRALQLIKSGYLTITEMFSRNALYGVFTGQEIGKDVEALREKIVKINALYDKAILEKRDNNFLPYVQCWKKQPSAQILPTRKRLRDELRETFGGESDTDGEGYESDNEREKLCSVFKI